MHCLQLLSRSPWTTQTFVFSVVTIDNERTKPRFEKNVGVKFKEAICAKLCLKPWFESDSYFCNITKVGWYKATVQKESPKQSLPKLTTKAAICR